MDMITNGTLFRIRLKELREKAGYSQYSFADKIGVSQSAVGSWEAGRREPNLTTIVGLARLFGVSVDYLSGNSNDPSPREIPPEEMAELEARADREAVAMTDAELVAKLPEELREGMAALIRLERERAEAKKKSEK